MLVWDRARVTKSTQPRLSRMPVESVSEPVCLSAKAACTGSGLEKKTSSMQSVHHKDNVTLSAGLTKIYRTHSWLLG